MSPCCFFNTDIHLVVDASVAINLNATGCNSNIIQAIPNRLVMTDVVYKELGYDKFTGRSDVDLTKQLIDDGHIKVVPLKERGEELFTQLISGSAAETLDDGEAATIALAVEEGGCALIDENKATRICAERYASLQVAHTVDLFAHPNVLEILGRDGLSDAVFGALQNARMNVHEHHIDWVVDLISPEKAALCNSLPKKIREDLCYKL